MSSAAIISAVPQVEGVGQPTEPTPASTVWQLAPTAALGHFDELRGSAAADKDQCELAARWQHFVEQLGDTGGSVGLNSRVRQLQRQLADNGVTYNVLAEPGESQRPWALDLFPLIIEAQDWRTIEAGVLQRVRLLNQVLADVYGPRELLQRALLPAALVQGHPGYLRAMHGVELAGNMNLHLAAFDLARAQDGQWRVVSQRTQAPSGLGYLLENRLVISRLFPRAFDALPVQHLAATYGAFAGHLKRLCAARCGEDDVQIVLLTPGPYSATWFEHAYLARYLGLPLVEGGDLTVRDQRLYLKTLRGLQPVHGVIKRVDDEYLDPLELRADSTLGVPGLLQAIRAGNVVMANAPGSAFLESPALLGFLPGLARHLLGEELALPSLATWWCGEPAAARAVLPRLAQQMIKPTAFGFDGALPFEAVRAATLDAAEIARWSDRIRDHGESVTVQSYLSMSQLPTWDPGSERVEPRSVMLRVFAVADGAGSWRVLPGGMARIATANEEIASMSRGGSSADVWALTDDAVDHSSLLPLQLTPALIAERRERQRVTSRAGENLFWLGRYTERAENTARLAKVTLEALAGEDAEQRTLLAWLDEMTRAHGLVPRGASSALRSRRGFERALIAALAKPDTDHSVGFNLRAIRYAAGALRERLTPDQWFVVRRSEDEFLLRCRAISPDSHTAALEALSALEIAIRDLSTMTGAHADRMLRDDGLRLLNAGRQIERLGFFSDALRRGFDNGAINVVGGFDAMVALFDSTITFRSHYQQSRDTAALIDLLVMDRANPRSLTWIAHNLRERLAKIAESSALMPEPLLQRVPDPADWVLEQLIETDRRARRPALRALLLQCASSAWQSSERITAACFSHSRVPDQAVSA